MPFTLRSVLPFAMCAALALGALGGPVLALAGNVSARSVAEALADPQIQAAIRVSIAASLVAVALAALVGIPTGYLIARRPGWWRVPAVLLIAIPLACPPVAAGILLLGALGSRTPAGVLLGHLGVGLVDAFAGVVASEFFVSAPLVVLTAAAAFGDLDPAFEESARTLGATSLVTFLRVALPIAAPTIAAGLLLAWLRALGEYGATSIVAYHPTSLPIALSVVLAARGLDPALAASSLFVVLAVAVILGQWALRRRLI